jgi:hypothetical protein
MYSAPRTWQTSHFGPKVSGKLKLFDFGTLAIRLEAVQAPLESVM